MGHRGGTHGGHVKMEAESEVWPHARKGQTPPEGGQARRSLWGSFGGAALCPCSPTEASTWEAEASACAVLPTAQGPTCPMWCSVLSFSTEIGAALLPTALIPSSSSVFQSS